MKIQGKEENEKKKEYLRSYIPLVKAAKRLEEELEELRLSTMLPSTNNDGLPGSSDKKDLSDYIVKVDKLMRKIIRTRYKRIEAYSKIFRDVERLDNEKERAVLTYRYLRGYSWEKICIEMNYSWKQVHRIHSNALANFKTEEDDIE